MGDLLARGWQILELFGPNLPNPTSDDKRLEGMSAGVETGVAYLEAFDRFFVFALKTRESRIIEDGRLASSFPRDFFGCLLVGGGARTLDSDLLFLALALALMGEL